MRDCTADESCVNSAIARKEVSPADGDHMPRHYIDGSHFRPLIGSLNSSA